MVPRNLHTLFWDTNLENFLPEAYPDYTIFRVLELGDRAAVEWMRQTFSDEEIRRVLTSEQRLTEKSARFWALVYGIPPSSVAALNGGRQPPPEGLP
jgi:hypothetical protein